MRCQAELVEAYFIGACRLGRFVPHRPSRQRAFRYKSVHPRPLTPEGGTPTALRAFRYYPSPATQLYRYASHCQRPSPCPPFGG